MWRASLHRIAPGMGAIVRTADLLGAVVFAAEGAMAAIQSRLDSLGVLVVALVSATGGGMIRDVLIGVTPPAALRDWRYAAAILVGVAGAVLCADMLRGPGSFVLLILDAAGLGLFTVAGTNKALAAGSGSYAAILLGAVTATGGGVVRELLLNHVPSILRIDFYATAALAGALLLILARKARMPPLGASIIGGIACFVLRMAGATLHWQLPVPG